MTETSRIFWIASYPRSGTTWVRMFLYNLISLLQGCDEEQCLNTLHQFSPHDANRVFYGKYLEWKMQGSIENIATVRPRAIQMIATDENDAVSQSNGYRFVKTNWKLGAAYNQQAFDFSMGNRAVYLVRNPLDVAVSLTHYWDTSAEAVVNWMCLEDAIIGGDAAPTLCGSWGINVESWTGQFIPEVTVLRYEDLLYDSATWFTILSRQIFKNPAPSPDQIEKAILRSAFSKLKEQEELAGYIEKIGGRWPFFREGATAQWKEFLTVRQVDSLVRSHGQQMARFGYLPESSS